MSPNKGSHDVIKQHKNQVSDRVGEPECERDDEKSSSGAGDCGCGDVRVSTTGAVQGSVVWLPGIAGR